MAQASTICSIPDQRDGPGLFRIHLELGKCPSSRRCRATTGSIETTAPISYELTWKTIVDPDFSWNTAHHCFAPLGS